MSDEEPLVTFQVRLPRALIRRIDVYRLATTLRPTRSQMVRFLIERAMDQLDQAKEEPDNAG